MLEEGVLEVCVLPEELLLQSSVPEQNVSWHIVHNHVCYAKCFGGVCLFTQY